MTDAPPQSFGYGKRSHAIALHYGVEDSAPKIVASGPGEIARRILQIAKENNVPIHQNDTLTSVLSNFEIGATVPEECYRAVAEILAFLFRTDLAWKDRKLASFPDFNKKSPK